MKDQNYDLLDYHEIVLGIAQEGILKYQVNFRKYNYLKKTTISGDYQRYTGSLYTTVERFIKGQLFKIFTDFFAFIRTIGQHVLIYVALNL